MKARGEAFEWYKQLVGKGDDAMKEITRIGIKKGLVNEGVPFKAVGPALAAGAILALEEVFGFQASDI